MADVCAGQAITATDWPPRRNATRRAVLRRRNDRRQNWPPPKPPVVAAQQNRPRNAGVPAKRPITAAELTAAELAAAEAARVAKVSAGEMTTAELAAAEAAHAADVCAGEMTAGELAAAETAHAADVCAAEAAHVAHVSAGEMSPAAMESEAPVEAVVKAVVEAGASDGEDRKLPRCHESASIRIPAIAVTVVVAGAIIRPIVGIAAVRIACRGAGDHSGRDGGAGIITIVVSVAMSVSPNVVAVACVAMCDIAVQAV